MQYEVNSEAMSEIDKRALSRYPVPKQRCIAQRELAKKARQAYKLKLINYYKETGRYLHE